MKLLTEYLLSKKQPKLSDKKSSKLEAWENCKGTQYIPANIMHNFIIDALDLNWLKPEDILKDFEGKDNFRNKLQFKTYMKFENILREIINDSVYFRKTDDILDALYENYLPIFLEIQEETK